MKQSMPNFAIEKRHKGIVCGVDEAGRGPLAGPVVAGAVILNKRKTPLGLNDSKKLSVKQRELLFEHIKTHHIWAVGVASVEEIDTLNILQATKLAMRRAVEGLSSAPNTALVDGNQPPELACDTVTVIKGDSLSLSIAAASVIAKVTRDGMMRELALQYPHYGFESHAGYGTKAHLDALSRLGACAIHRRSFAPVAAAYLKAAA